MKIGDVIICRRPVSWGKKAFYGIVVEYEPNLDGEEIDWALILWGNDTMTWEDVECSLEDGTFEVIK